MLDTIPSLEQDITRAVRIALEEDIGTGDITARLIPAEKTATATIITREECVVCGIPWVDEVFKQLDPGVTIEWHVKDGDKVEANTTFCTLSGNARSLLTGERTALNFLQLLSGTATTSRQYADLVKDSHIKILDTRKTIPGLRTAQKYAVRVGGCYNHRMGLYDAFLIKENHIAACGGIREAIEEARRQEPGKTVEIEVESIEELEQALRSDADIVMLDEFSNDDLTLASQLIEEQNYKTKIEISGGVSKAELASLISSPANFASSGALSKNVDAVDLSFRII